MQSLPSSWLSSWVRGSTWRGALPTPTSFSTSMVFTGSGGWSAYSKPQITRLKGHGCSLRVKTCRKKAAQPVESMDEVSPVESSCSGVSDGTRAPFNNIPGGCPSGRALRYFHIYIQHSWSSTCGHFKLLSNCSDGSASGEISM